jgi:hypothetical protein
MEKIRLRLGMTEWIRNFLEKRTNDFVKNALTDTTYVVSIPQKIGGELLCQVHYSNDFHSWDYYVNYTYTTNKEDSIEIGSGRYSGEDWKRNEQIKSIGNWYALKTGSDWKSDKLLIGKIDSGNKWKEYVFSPEIIESERLWQTAQVNSDPNNGDSEVRIKTIEDNGEIIVGYVFAKKDRVFAFMTGRRTVKYLLNSQSGVPYLSEISE